MPRALNNKQLAVLAVLRRSALGLSVQDVADAIREAHPCGYCNGTGGDPEPRHFNGRGNCQACYGWGKVPFHYSDAYTALTRLRKAGFVERTCKRDRFGDELPTHLYFATAAPDLADPLERAFAAPAAGRGERP